MAYQDDTKTVVIVNFEVNEGLDHDREFSSVNPNEFAEPGMTSRLRDLFGGGQSGNKLQRNYSTKKTTTTTTTLKKVDVKKDVKVEQKKDEMRDNLKAEIREETVEVLEDNADDIRSGQNRRQVKNNVQDEIRYEVREEIEEVIGEKAAEVTKNKAHENVVEKVITTRVVEKVGEKQVDKKKEDIIQAKVAKEVREAKVEAKVGQKVEKAEKKQDIIENVQYRSQENHIGDRDRLDSDRESSSTSSVDPIEHIEPGITSRMRSMFSASPQTENQVKRSYSTKKTTTTTTALKKVDVKKDVKVEQRKDGMRDNLKAEIREETVEVLEDNADDIRSGQNRRQVKNNVQDEIRYEVREEIEEVIGEKAVEVTKNKAHENVVEKVITTRVVEKVEEKQADKKKEDIIQAKVAKEVREAKVEAKVEQKAEKAEKKQDIIENVQYRSQDTFIGDRDRLDSDRESSSTSSVDPIEHIEPGITSRMRSMFSASPQTDNQVRRSYSTNKTTTTVVIVKGDAQEQKSEKRKDEMKDNLKDEIREETVEVLEDNAEEIRSGQNQRAVKEKVQDEIRYEVREEIEEVIGEKAEDVTKNKAHENFVENVITNKVVEKVEEKQDEVRVDQRQKVVVKQKVVDEVRDAKVEKKVEQKLERAEVKQDVRESVRERQISVSRDAKVEKKVEQELERAEVKQDVRESVRERQISVSRGRHRVLIVYAHAFKESYEGSLVGAAVKLFKDIGAEFQVSNLFEMGFNPVASPKDFGGIVKEREFYNYSLMAGQAKEHGKLAQDIVREQDKVEWADFVLIVTPLQSHGFPALLKGWFDRIMTYKFAFAEGQFYERGRLRGKRALLCLTTDALSSMYSPRGIHGDLNVYLWPLLNGILRFAGFDVLKPQVYFGAGRASEDYRETAIETLQERLRRVWDEQPLSFIATDRFTEDNGFTLTDRDLVELEKAKMLTVGQRGMSCSCHAVGMQLAHIVEPARRRETVVAAVVEEKAGKGAKKPWYTYW